MNIEGPFSYNTAWLRRLELAKQGVKSRLEREKRRFGLWFVHYI